MTDTSIDFLYLDEPDMIEAGVRDMPRCVDVMEETLILVREGDTRMPGRTNMGHGAWVGFPKEPKFEGMPADGPDRRFMAMPGYIGGRFGTTGVKWYGSNVENRKKGLPRSIHLFVLNDTDTGAPLALMSGNLISAYRTGAVPGVAVKYLAKKDSKVYGLVGPGVIGRAVTEATLYQHPEIDRLVVKGYDAADVQRFADYIKPLFPQIKTVENAETVEEVARESDILTVAVAGASEPIYIDHKWIKPGALLLLPAEVRFDEEFHLARDTRKVIDSLGLWDAMFEEFGEQFFEDMDSPGGRWYKLIRSGKLTEDDIQELADIATGKIPGRQNDEEIILFSSGGMPAEDVAWGTEVYNNAVKKGIGKTLNLWETPALS